jgi:ACS family hexuronate transporter-like MFS transporter
MPTKIKNLRWYVAAMLMAVTCINYLDRQSLAVAQTELERLFHMTNTDYGTIGFAFLLAYGIMHPFMGRIIDWMTTRRGLALAVSFWSLINMCHALAGSVFSFAAFRAMLGVGEAGNFPGAAKAVAEWFPAKERAMATGLFNVGAGLGAAIAPPLVGLLIIHWGWQAAFIGTGLIGFVWVGLWLILYQQPEKHPRLSPNELHYIRSGQIDEREKQESVRKGIWKEALQRKELWALVLARLLSDPVWLFYTLWLPKYFKTARGFDIKQIAMFVWIPFVAADLGSIAGGAISAWFVKRGYDVIKARKIALCISACMMPMAIPAVFVDNWLLALLFVSIPTFGHQSWAASILTLPADLFPKRMVASVYGMSGTLGILFGAAVQVIVGRVVDMSSYVPVFVAAAFMHPIAASIILAMVKSQASRAAIPQNQSA